MPLLELASDGWAQTLGLHQQCLWACRRWSRVARLECRASRSQAGHAWIQPPLVFREHARRHGVSGQSPDLQESDRTWETRGDRRADPDRNINRRATRSDTVWEQESRPCGVAWWSLLVGQEVSTAAQFPQHVGGVVPVSGEGIAPVVGARWTVPASVGNLIAPDGWYPPLLGMRGGRVRSSGGYCWLASRPRVHSG